MPHHHAPSFVKLQPVPTLQPAPEDEGTLRECPICFDEIKENKSWLLLPCKHGICTSCYQKLVQDLHHVTTCPLCRMPLLEPVPLQLIPTDSADVHQDESSLTAIHMPVSYIAHYGQLHSSSGMSHAQHPQPPVLVSPISVV